MNTLPLVMRAVLDQPWAVLPAKLDAVLAVLSTRATGRHATEDDIRAALGGEGVPQAKASIGGGVAVLPLQGLLVPRANGIEESSGVQSLQRFGAWVDEATRNEQVHTLLLDVDSPGGSVGLVAETWAKLMDARAAGKRVVAQVNTLAASAAYWIASAADEIVCTPSGDVGAIGVITVRADYTKAAEQEGVAFHVLTSGKYKGEGHPLSPMTDEEREATLARLDAVYGQFVTAIAKGRGVAPSAVRSGFGEGRVVGAAAAKAAGMVDRIATLDETLARLTTKRSVRVATRAAANSTGMAATSTAAAPGTITLHLDASALMADLSDLTARLDGATAPAAEAPAPVPLSASGGEPAPSVVPLPTPALKAKDHMTPEEIAALRAENDALKAKALRVEGFAALRKEHPSLTAKLNEWEAAGLSLDAVTASVRKHLEEQLATRTIRVGEPNTTGALPNEAKRPWGSDEYQALRAKVDSGALKRTDARFRQARDTAFGEQLKAIADFGMNRGSDPRLFAAVSTGGASANVGADGAFLIQKDFTVDLLASTFEGGQLLSRVDSHEVGANADGLEVIYLNETSRATGSRWGGVQVYRGAEADSATAKKPQIGKWEVRLEDIIGAAYMTERLLQDAPSMAAVFSAGFAGEFQFTVENEIFRGSGAGECLGFTASNGPRVEVAKETGQTADTIVHENVKKMWARIHPRSKSTGVWFINTACNTQLMDMQVGTGTSAALVYMPPGGISGAPYATLFGRPVIEIEYASALGDAGDIVFADLSRYKVITKGGLQADDSIHVRFLNNERTFRWITRVNGAPKDKSAITPFKGSDTLSPFVTLAAR